MADGGNEDPLMDEDNLWDMTVSGSYPEYLFRRSAKGLPATSSESLFLEWNAVAGMLPSR